MQCSQCSSIDFEKISDNQYRCRYCGAMRFVDHQYVKDGTVSSGIPLKTPKGRLMAIIIAAAAVMVLGGLAASLLYVPKGGSGEGTSGSVEGDAVDLPEYGAENISRETQPQGSFSMVSAVPDSIGNVYFIGIYKNTGAAPLRKPMVVVTLFSKEGRKVAAGRGYAIRDLLLPSEETPVSILIARAPAYHRIETGHKPELPYSFTSYRRPKMEFRDVRMKKGQYTGYDIEGEIHNKDRRALRFVNIAAVILDSKKKIIGYGTGYVKEDILDSGDYSPFVISITTVAGEPDSFRLDYEGSPVQ